MSRIIFRSSTVFFLSLHFSSTLTVKTPTQTQKHKHTQTEAALTHWHLIIPQTQA